MSGRNATDQDRRNLLMYRPVTGVPLESRLFLTNANENKTFQKSTTRT